MLAPEFSCGYFFGVWWCTCLVSKMSNEANFPAGNQGTLIPKNCGSNGEKKELSPLHSLTNLVTLDEPCWDHAELLVKKVFPPWEDFTIELPFKKADFQALEKKGPMAS